MNDPWFVVLRRRVGWTAVLVLVALGGAGLATAADRPARHDLRPELFARADRRASPWLDAMGRQVQAVDGRLYDVATSARDVLTSLQRLDPVEVARLVADGDDAANRLEVALTELADTRAGRPAGFDETRLGRPNRERLAGVDSVLEAAAAAPFSWRTMARTARQVSAMLVNVFEHERLVFRATSAARQERWSDALELIDQGRAALAQASEARHRLVDHAGAPTIDDVLDRYADYSAALAELYAALRDGATVDDPEVRELRGRVERAQAALPADTRALRVGVNELAGATLAEAVVEIERARGVVTQVVGTLP